MRFSTFNSNELGFVDRAAIACSQYVDQDIIQVEISADHSDLFYRCRKYHLIRRCAECHVATEEGSELRGIISPSMNETHSDGLQVTICQLSAYASKHHHGKLDLMAVGMPRNPGIFEIDPYPLCLT